jgi:hypothetical protein
MLFLRHLHILQPVFKTGFEHLVPSLPQWVVAADVAE